MKFLLKIFIRIIGYYLKKTLDKATKNPKSTQKNILLSIINQNRNSEYGSDFKFESIKNISDFQNIVPIIQYQKIEPYIEKIANGNDNILTRNPIIMFNQTSGTNDKPKLIPVTDEVKKDTNNLMIQWLYRNLIDHPKFLDKDILIISGSHTEGKTKSGITYGALSGLIYKNLPKLLKNNYVLPYFISQIKNYELKYYIISRLGIEKDISFISSPNPTTLIKIADIGIKYKEEIISSIKEGSLFSNIEFTINNHDKEIIERINSKLKANIKRAKVLEKIIQENMDFLPSNYWKSLKLIGCWLGGNVGYHANKLNFYYGDIAKRDIGYLASEGVFSLPYQDATSASILAIENNYYEFVSTKNKSSKILLTHELIESEQYRILITNKSGLYRYEINDIIKVEGFYNKTPIISFIGKTDNFINITGEKIHIEQIILCFKKIEKTLNISIQQFRVSANKENLRYDIFINFKEDVSKQQLLNEIDKKLSDINIEYLSKRNSERLNAPVLHIMRDEWAENIKKDAIESGKKDIQYKWNSISNSILENDLKYILETVKINEVIK